MLIKWIGPVEGSDQSKTEISSVQKIAACRVVTDQICAPSLRYVQQIQCLLMIFRSSSEFPRFLSVAVAALLRVAGDNDVNVRTVADESINRIIRVQITFVIYILILFRN